MNSPAMPGRPMTWNDWIEDYYPREIVLSRNVRTTNRLRIFQSLHCIANSSGIAIGDEWRSDDGLWWMRGDRVNKAKEESTPCR